MLIILHLRDTAGHEWDAPTLHSSQTICRVFQCNIFIFKCCSV